MKSKINQEDLWSQLIDVNFLHKAYHRVRANNGGAGGDGIGQLAFAQSHPVRIGRLATELASGFYRPGRFRTIAIPKKISGERILAIPCIIDRVAQTAVVTLLNPILDATFEPSSFAYRPDRGVTKAVQTVVRHRRAGYKWTVKGDVARCFDEIPHDLLLAKLEAIFGSGKLIQLIALWLGAYAPSGIGIPQGSPLSPLLCNLHLDAVDEAIAGNGVRFVRYADDFVILTKTAGSAEKAMENVSALLRTQSLELNPDKCRIVAADQALHFLGHIFVRSMAWKEVDVDDDLPAPPDAPPEEILAQWAKASAATEEENDATPETRPSRLRALYIVEPGALLGVRNESFMVMGPEFTNDDGTKGRAGRMIEHARLIDRIEVGPSAQANWDALNLAASRDIPVAIVDGFGATTAWLGTPGDLRASRIMAQARWLANDSNRDELAMAIVRGRVRNQQKRLRKINLSRDDHELVIAADKLRTIANGLPDAAAPGTAVGFEGAAAAIYWKAFARCIPPAFGFETRERYPPPCPVNACLGYLLALLGRDVKVALERAGLHPGIGALHVAGNHRDALVYDMMEAFRVQASEGLIMTLIGRNIIRPDMFAVSAVIEGDGREVRTCRMELVARRALIQGYESLTNQLFASRRTGKKILWRALLEEEARALCDVFMGEAETFAPFEMGY
jgi:CRISP-associated protein Cas1